MKQKRTWFVKQIHITTKKLGIHSMGLQWTFIRNKYLYPRVPPFREKIAYVSIIYKISSCGAKKNVICQANTYYNKTKLDIHSRGLYWSFIRNKYLYPRVPPFWEKIAYVSIFYKILSCGAKKERDLSSKYTLQRKNSVYTQWNYSGLSNEINIYIPEFHHFEKKLLM